MYLKAQARHDPKEGTLLLDFDPADLSPKIEAILYEGQRFNPKDELHVTVIGRSAAKRLAASGVGEDTVAGLVERLPKTWRVRRLDRWWRVEDRSWKAPTDDEPGGRGSLIEEIQCHEGEVFFTALQREMDDGLETPPFHITWYVRRDPRGIALPSHAVLEKVGTRIESLTDS